MNRIDRRGGGEVSELLRVAEESEDYGVPKK